MKTKLHLLLYGFLFIAAFGFTNKAVAQINYTANFNTGMNNWQSDLFEQTDVAPCSGGGALWANIYYWEPSAQVISPSLGTSNGGMITFNYSYKVVDYDFEDPSTPTENASQWGAIQVFYATSLEGPFNLIQTIDPTNHVESASCAAKSATFYAPAGSPVYIGIRTVLGNEDSDIIVYIDQVSATQAAPVTCSGAPATSTTVASSTASCNTQTTRLSLSTAYTDLGINYQWQSSTDGVTYTNVATGGTAATYSATQSASTWYRAIIRCGAAGGPSVTSTPVQVVSTGIPCYCDIEYTNNIEPITLVNFAGINNVTSATVNGTPGVENFTLLPAGQVTKGQTYTITVKGNTVGDYSDKVMVYFDWNHDGDLIDQGEAFEVGTLLNSTGADAMQITAQITVPANAVTGNTYMRVFKLFNYFATGPCSSEIGAGYGQAEDYLVNVQPATGCTTPAPTVSNATQTICGSGTVANLQATGTAIKWYSAATGGTALTATTALVNGTVYYATQTPAGGCESTTRTPVTVAITNTAAPVVSNATQSVCGAGTVANLQATGTEVKWYSAATGGTALANTAALTNGSVYYASQTVSGCESVTRTPVTVTITTTAAPVVSNANQPFCGAGTVANLQATGTEVKWYSAATGGTALANTAALTNGSVYYASQTVSGCESVTRTPVTVTITTTAAPVVSNATQPLCGAGTVANLQATGTDVKWYATATGGTALANTAALTNGSVYYASQTIAGCESMTRTPVTVTITTTAAPTAQASQTVCAGSTINELNATGTGNIVWYSAATGGVTLNDTQLVTEGAHYFAAQVVNGCESLRTDVTAHVTVTPLPTGPATQTFDATMPGEITLENIEIAGATGGTITWYATEQDALNGENALSANSPVANDTTYYATQTVNGCESAPYAVRVALRLDTKQFEAGSFTYHPNPVVNVLTVSYTQSISSVEVYNVLGQQVMVKTVNQNEAQLDMSQLASGTYMVKITSADAAKTIKVVKQ
jgi:hypothetical protein